MHHKNCPDSCCLASDKYRNCANFEISHICLFYEHFEPFKGDLSRVSTRVCVFVWQWALCGGAGQFGSGREEEETGNRFGFPISRNLNFNQLLAPVREGPQHCTAAPGERVCVPLLPTCLIPKYSFYEQPEDTLAADQHFDLRFQTWFYG